MTAKKSLLLQKESHNSKKSVSMPAPRSHKKKENPNPLLPPKNGGSVKRQVVPASVVSSKKSIPPKTKSVASTPSPKSNQAKHPTPAPKTAVSHHAKSHGKKDNAQKKEIPNNVAPSSYPVRSPSKAPTFTKPTPTSQPPQPPSNSNKRAREDPKDERCGKFNGVEVKDTKAKPSAGPIKPVLGKTHANKKSEPPRPSSRPSSTPPSHQNREGGNYSHPLIEVDEFIGKPFFSPPVHVSHYTVVSWPLSANPSAGEGCGASDANFEGRNKSFFPAIAFCLSNTTHGVWFPQDGSCLQILTAPSDHPAGDPSQVESCVLYVNPAGHAMVFRLESRWKTTPAEGSAGGLPPGLQWLLIPTSLHHKFKLLPGVHRWAGDFAKATSAGEGQRGLMTEFHAARWWDPARARQTSWRIGSQEVFSFGLRVVFARDEVKKGKSDKTTPPPGGEPPRSKSAAWKTPPFRPELSPDLRWFIPYVCTAHLPPFSSGEKGGGLTKEDHMPGNRAAATPSSPPHSQKGVWGRESQEMEGWGKDWANGRASSRLEGEEPCARFTLANTLERYPDDLFYIHPREQNF
ncbi:unnamed protein product [Phytomonas sp. Hart1]|nr:unnamed protein product [Phytomonas sp. Hart1]|eukprot:CCW67683.1 unnamed protein product [Phytomonas sp. isolate Hart1]